MQWMFQTPVVSIVNVQKTVSYNNLYFSRGRPSKLGPSGDKIIPFSTLSTRYKSPSLLFHVQMNTYNLL